MVGCFCGITSANSVALFWLSILKFCAQLHDPLTCFKLWWVRKCLIQWSERFWLLTTQIKSKTAFQSDACHPLYQSYVFQWPPFHVWCLVGVVPQVNKFVQVSNDDHQIPVPGGMGAGATSDVCVWRGRSPWSPRSDLWGPTNLMMQSAPSRCEEADACENITCPQIRLRVVINIAHVWILFFIQCERHLISEILSLHPVTDG